MEKFQIVKNTDVAPKLKIIMCAFVGTHFSYFELYIKLPQLSIHDFVVSAVCMTNMVHPQEVSNHHIPIWITLQLW
jgi:hypothetical protein